MQDVYKRQPVYNVQKYLRNCLDSVVTQTYEPIEVILVDDGSTDQSGKICDEYADRDSPVSYTHLISMCVKEENLYVWNSWLYWR